MRWRRTKLCWRYGGSCDPFDVDGDYVRKGREVRYVTSSFDGAGVVYFWCPVRGDFAPYERATAAEWSAWAGESVQLVEPAPWFWCWDWAIALWLRLRGRLD